MTSRRAPAWSAAALLAVPLAAGVVLLGTSGAAAGDVGRHVRTCAQQSGLDGTHDPGLHRGASGWDVDHHVDHHADHHVDGDPHC